MLEALVAEMAKESRLNEPSGIAELLDRFTRMNEKKAFKPGDIVDWKPGLKNRKSVGPFVVVEVLPTAIMSTDESSGSAYFREPLDIILGFVYNGALVTFHFDSRRFQLYSGQD